MGLQDSEDEVEVSEEELRGLSPEEREKVFDDYLQDHIANNIDAYWKVVEE